MKILYLASEATGLIKTGGLADVARALPMALRQSGHDVRLVLPYYHSIARTHPVRTVVPFLGVPMGNTELFCSVHQLLLDQLPVYLIEYQHFFFRSHPYEELGGAPHPDNPERFGFLCKAALQLCSALQFFPDILHANDWQGALACLYLQGYRQQHEEFASSRSVLSVHNGGYQGHCPAEKRAFLGIGEDWFHPKGFEDHGQMNLLKGGLWAADKINAVSEGYADELQTSLGGHGLHESYQARSADLCGILNGCEYEVWNPAEDHYLPVNYDLPDLAGKASCKSVLQAELRLSERADIPLVGIVSRLTGQKGFDFSLPALWETLQGEVQFAVLGSGDPWIAREFERMNAAFPEKLSFYNGYNEALAHRIEAGSDLFLMPSLYEPCGLNQMYSLRYGTLPIVRAVGGLRDTVWEENRGGEVGTGFVFEEPSSEATREVLQRALRCYQDQPGEFRQRVRQAMRQRFSWEQAAQRYVELYQRAVDQPPQESNSPRNSRSTS